MAKYDEEFKLKVVRSYLNGEGGYKSIANFTLDNKNIILNIKQNLLRLVGRDYRRIIQSYYFFV